MYLDDEHPTEAELNAELDPDLDPRAWYHPCGLCGAFLPRPRPDEPWICSRCRSEWVKA